MKTVNLRKSVVMCSKLKSILFPGVYCLLITLYACTNSISNAPNLSVDRGLLTVTGEGDFMDVTVKIDSISSFNMQVASGDSVNILNLLKLSKQFYNEIAYVLVMNRGDVKMSFSLKGNNDTTIVAHVEPMEVGTNYAKVIEGVCAPLLGAYEIDNVESNIIKWAYRKNLGNIGDSTIRAMTNYLLLLNHSEFNDYVVNNDIPVVNSFKGINYKIESDLMADRYYLFASKTESDIESFVEEMISMKFEGATSSLNERMSCFRNPSTSGVVCVSLIGIDHDWKYTVVPVGLVCIDNIKPSIQMAGYTIEVNDYIILPKNHIRIAIPKETPNGNEFVVLQTNDFGGNGVSCNVNFRLDFEGDVKDVTLVREGMFAKWLSRKRMVIDLQNVESPYMFSFELHLEEGDNYLPVIVTDKVGNKTEYQFNIPSHFVSKHAPAINIENNIDNNIY